MTHFSLEKGSTYHISSCRHNKKARDIYSTLRTCLREGTQIHWQHFSKRKPWSLQKLRLFNNLPQTNWQTIGWISPCVNRIPSVCSNFIFKKCKFLLVHFPTVWQNYYKVQIISCFWSFWLHRRPQDVVGYFVLSAFSMVSLQAQVESVFGDLRHITPD